MGRIPRINRSFGRSRAALGLSAAEARAVGATASTLARADSLPMPGDIEALLPREWAELVLSLDGRQVVSAWVRRVPAHRLWVWYLPRVGVLVLLLVTRPHPRPR